MIATKDREIRAALHTKRLSAFHNAPDTIVIDELGLSHAKVRIDVAVINGCVHGYEIKSSLDTLDRLPAQLDLYSQCLEKLTLVCAPRHIDNVLKFAPAWCGLVKAEKGKRGAMNFATLRKSTMNRQIDPVQLAHLLWRPEAMALLAGLGVSEKLSKLPRRELYGIIASHLSIKQLTVAIRESMRARLAWRGPQARA